MALSQGPNMLGGERFAHGKHDGPVEPGGGIFDAAFGTAPDRPKEYGPHWAGFGEGSSGPARADMLKNGASAHLLTQRPFVLVVCFHRHSSFVPAIPGLTVLDTVILRCRPSYKPSRQQYLTL